MTWQRKAAAYRTSLDMQRNPGCSHSSVPSLFLFPQVLQSPSGRRYTAPGGTHLLTFEQVPSSEGPITSGDEKFVVKFNTIGNFAVLGTASFVVAFHYSQIRNQGCSLQDKQVVYNLQAAFTIDFNHPLAKQYGNIGDVVQFQSIQAWKHSFNCSYMQDWRPTIQPEPAGNWMLSYWARQLTFTPSEPYTKSTVYTVTVRFCEGHYMHSTDSPPLVQIEKGVKSFFDDELGQEFTLRFSTPTIQVTQVYPEYTVAQARDATCWVCFDQIIDAEAVLPLLSVSQSRWKSSHSSLRLLSQKVRTTCLFSLYPVLIYVLGSSSR